MLSILKFQKPIKTALLLLGLGLLLLFASSTPVDADLAGSNLTFVPSPEGSSGAACYIPGRGQTLCFQADTYTSDGQDVSTLFIEFPSDWNVEGYAPTLVSSTCAQGTFSGAVYWSGYGYGQGYSLEHDRLQEPGDHCSAVYCIDMTASESTVTDVSVPWSWYSNDHTSTVAPYRPCSSDGFYGPVSTPPCDETINPPATIPVCAHTELNILPETLPAAEAGSYYSQQFTVSNTEEEIWWTSDGVSGCWFYSNTGLLECFSNTIPAAGSYNFTVYVESRDSWATGSHDYTLIVNPRLEFTPAALLKGRQNLAYQQAVTVSGGASPYILTMTGGTLPAGMTFDEDTDSFTGTPTETGTFSDIVIQAVDSNGVTKAKTYSLTILPEHLFTWDPTEPLENQTVTFTAVPGFSSYYWFRGNNPGVTCEANNTYLGYGSPMSAAFWQPGQFQVCLQVYDQASGTFFFDNQWVTVLNGPPGPVWFGIYPQPSFPGVAVSGSGSFSDSYNGPYSVVVDWGDGTTNDAFSITNTYFNLPPHTYTATGNYTAEVSVTDKDGLTSFGTTTHDVVHVIAEDYAEWLASNTLPTTIELFGVGIDSGSMSFAIDQVPAYGTLSALSAASCQPGSMLSSQVAPESQSDLFTDKGGLTLDRESEEWAASVASALNAPTRVGDLVYCKATVVYTPTDIPAGGVYDLFTFTFSDGTNVSAPGSINLWVAPNAAPTAQDSAEVVSAVSPVYVILTATDPDYYDYYSDRVTFSLDSSPSNGTLSPFEEPDCYVSWEDPVHLVCTSAALFTPYPGTTAPADSFTFHVNDTHQDSNVATVSLQLRVPETVRVNTLDDEYDESGCTPTHCNLSEAIYSAQNGDIVGFEPGLTGTITLFNTLIVNKHISIEGPGADVLAISGGGGDPENMEGVLVLAFYNDYQPMIASVSGLTIRDGRTSQGGGILVTRKAVVTITDSVIGPNNIVSYAGGGVANDGGTLTLNRCTVVNNHGTGTLGGAGIASFNNSHTTVMNSTISGNITNNYGGGILSAYGGVIDIVNSTVSGNLANKNYDTEPWGGGGGVAILDDGFVSIQNTIVAGNEDWTDPLDHAVNNDVSGAFVSLGGNLIGDSSGSSGWVGSDLVGDAASPLDPVLGALALNAPGTSPTFALLEGSPAIDTAVCPAGVTVDQRGVERPQGSACDIGAFELEQAPDTTPPVVTVPLDMSVTTTNPAGLIVSFTATAEDDVDGSLAVTCDPASGSFFPVGLTPVTCTATDSSGNIGVGSFNVNVTYAPPLLPSLITATRTTCSEFKGGTASNLAFLQYTVTTNRKTKVTTIKSVLPSGFAYYFNVSAAGTYLVDQKVDIAFPAMTVNARKVVVLDRNCIPITGTWGGGVTVDLDQTVTLTNLPAGAIVMVPYASKSVIGTVVSAPYPEPIYTFSVNLQGSGTISDADLSLVYQQ